MKFEWETRNINRDRAYGLRIGDIVKARGLDRRIIENLEVVGYCGDNNKVYVRNEYGSVTDWVAEWCELVTKVEDRTDG